MPDHLGPRSQDILSGSECDSGLAIGPMVETGTIALSLTYVVHGQQEVSRGERLH